MGWFLSIVGFGWALLGVANCAGTLSNDPSEGIMMLSFMVNGGMFLLPGLIIGGIGARMVQSAKQADRREAAEQGRIQSAVQAALAADRAERAQHRAPSDAERNPSEG